jgi:hypothetical protein
LPRAPYQELQEAFALLRPPLSRTPPLDARCRVPLAVRWVDPGSTSGGCLRRLSPRDAFGSRSSYSAFVGALAPDESRPQALEICLLPRFSCFLSAAFCGLFSPFCCASGCFSASGSLHFFCQSLPISHLFPPATRPARLISAFPIFFIHPPRVLFIPISGTPASASGAKVYSPVFFPFFLRTPRSFCSLSASLLSRALLLSSRLLSFSVSFSPPLLISFFSAPPPLLLSSSAPPGAYQCLARRGPPNSLSHTCEHVAARTDEKHRMEHPWNILTRGESYQNHHRGKQGRNPGKVTLPSSLVSASPQAACRSSACTARLRGHAQRPHQFTPRPRPSARTCPRREARAGTRQRAAAATRAAHAARRAPTRRSRWPPRAWCQIGRAI